MTLLPGPALGQTREIREQREEALRRLEERLARIQEELEQARLSEVDVQARLEQVREHQAQARVTYLKEAREQAQQDLEVQEARARMLSEEARDQAITLQEMVEKRAQEHQIQAQQAYQELALKQARTRELREELIQERRLQERDLSRELAERARLRSLESRERMESRLRDAQQVVVRMRARARLGVSLNGSQGAEYDRQGARISGVTEDSPAEEAGLEEGDIITHVDGHSLLEPIPDEDEEDFDEDASLPVQRLMALAGDFEDGQEVEVRYLRDGDPHTVTLEARDLRDTWVTRVPRGFGGRIYGPGPEGRLRWSFVMPDSAFVLHLDSLGTRMGRLEDLDIRIPDFEFDTIRGMGFWEGGTPDIRFFEGRESPGLAVFRGGENLYFGLAGGRIHGLDLRKINAGLGEYFSTDHGVLVLDADEDSTLGLQPGDVILAIGDREVDDVSDVLRILRSYEDDEAVTFTVMRQGRETSVEGTVG